jgi:hypothetical protein
MFARTIVTLLLAQLFTACTTGTSGLHQKFTLRAMDSKTYQLIDNAACTIKPDDEPEFKLNTPKTIELRRGQGNLTVTCTKSGYKPEVEVIPQSINESFYEGMSNVVTRIGGYVDLLTGAVFDYPNQVTVLMRGSRHAK